MDKVYIITAGCSFTDSNVKVVSNENTKLVCEYFDDYEKIVTNQPTRYQNFLAFELIKKNISFELINVGMGCAGNHIIKNLYFEALDNLLEKGIKSSQIYTTVQLSGIYRPTACPDSFKVYNEWVYDYVESNHYDNVYENLLEKHILNIRDIINYNKENKIKGKIFWGWANLTEFELKLYKVFDLYNKLDSDYLINFEYEKNIDDAKSGPTKNFLFLQKVYNSLIKKDQYLVQPGKFGGMLEIVRQYKKPNQFVYVNEWDSHLNGIGNFIFYKNFYRKIFENWNIIDKQSIFDLPKYKIIIDKLSQICSEHYLSSINNRKSFEDNFWQDNKKIEYINKFFKNG